MGALYRGLSGPSAPAMLLCMAEPPRLVTVPPRLVTVPLPTFGGKQIWADEYVFCGYRIQENVLTGHHRLLGPRNARLAWGTFNRCMERFQQLRAERGLHRMSDHLVLLLHGIFRAKEAFNPMRRALRTAGFAAEAVNYPSTQA
ncbi:MAG: hypothetical protein JRI25_25675, partial [Deltaproteobacteria bacterium]|nr:hypothetical protein [Deltaproteobacteria bacterium]